MYILLSLRTHGPEHSIFVTNRPTFILITYALTWDSMMYHCTDPTRNPSGFETGSSHFATSDQTLWF